MIISPFVMQTSRFTGTKPGRNSVMLCSFSLDLFRCESFNIKKTFYYRHYHNVKLTLSDFIKEFKQTTKLERVHSASYSVASNLSRQTAAGPPGLQERRRTPDPVPQVAVVYTSHSNSYSNNTDSSRNSSL